MLECNWFDKKYFLYSWALMCTVKVIENGLTILCTLQQLADKYMKLVTTKL